MPDIDESIRARAAAAIERDPSKSDSKIADAIRVGKDRVLKAADVAAIRAELGIQPPGPQRSSRASSGGSLPAAFLRRRRDVKALIREYLSERRAGASAESAEVVSETRLKQDLRADTELFRKAAASNDMAGYRTRFDGEWYWAEPDVIEYIEAV